MKVFYSLNYYLYISKSFTQLKKKSTFHGKYYNMFSLIKMLKNYAI